MLPSSGDIQSAALRLRGIIERTPLMRSAQLSACAGTDVYIKCEHLQRTGSFKLRGAYNALATLAPDDRRRGIVASSAGNHGLGVAYAARLLGMRARVFVPASAPTVKRDGIRALGADVDVTQPDYDAAHHAAIEYGATHGLTFVNPCAGAELLAGQGTVALEILEELPDMRTVIVPVGGGGLVGGVASFLRDMAPNTHIVGAQTDRTNAMAASLAAGHRVDVPVVSTQADGLAGQIDDEGLEIGRFAIDEMRVVSEAQVSGAMRGSRASMTHAWRALARWALRPRSRRPGCKVRSRSSCLAATSTMRAGARPCHPEPQAKDLHLRLSSCTYGQRNSPCRSFAALRMTNATTDTPLPCRSHSR